ncbi:MAG: SRPBCC family protein [Alphaproteobacteria bacterium]|nr:SRPBCC family protein [Alphaproteobacteria bacterium]
MQVYRTFQSIMVPAPASEVWNLVRDFHDFSWSKVIEKCEAVGDKPGDMVGAQRVLNGAFKESLIEHNDGTYSMRYSIDDGLNPVAESDVKEYVGHLQVRPITNGDTSYVEWSSSWKSDGDEAVEFCSGIYNALLGELAEHFS